MSGGFFRGTTADQDTRFSNKQAKLLKTHKFPPELDQSVDIAKVKMDVIKPWIATRVTELLGFEDEVLINFIYGLLESKNLDGKQIQIQLTGFMEKNTSKFMKELWGLLISAQNNASGVPQQFLDAKQLEIQKKKEESERIMEEIQKKREKEKAEEELERKNKRADETLIPEEEISAKDPTKHNNKSPSRNRKSPLASRSRSNSPSRDDGDKWRRRVIRPHRRRRSPSPYRRSGRRYRSPDFAPRRSSPSRRRSPPHSSRRRSPPPPPPQRKRSPSPYERPSQEEYRRKDNRRPPAQHFTDADVAEKPRQHTRDRTVISSKIRRLSPDGSPAGSESPDFVLRKSPPQRRRSASPYGSRSMRDRKVISTKNRHSPSPPRNESARYKRRHDSPEMSPDEEPAPRARKSEIVRRAVHEPSESPDERDNNYGPKRKQKESFPPDDYNNYNNDDYVPKRKSKEYVKSKRYEVEEEEEYGPGSFKKQQKKKMGEFSSESEYETEKRHKGKRKQKKYEKHSDESSEESELSDEEFRRKRREKERHLKKEEKREKYEEKRKRKSEVRNEDFGDESEEEERQKRLEVELREKALQSLRAKKGSSNC